MPRRILPLILATLLIASACSHKPKQSSESQQPATSTENTQQQAATPTPAPAPAPEPAPPAQETAKAKPPQPLPQSEPEPVAKAPAPKPKPPEPLVIPAGTPITVRLVQTVDVKKSKPGDIFEGTVAHAVSSPDGRTLIPASSPVTGTVVDAVAPGKFKGEGSLSVKLTEVAIKGVSYPISTSAVANSVKGKGSRTAKVAGGSAAGGALIGGLAGGGKGAAIGALVGGGAGTVGAAATGNKELSFPAESALTFKLQQPVTLKGGGATAPSEHAMTDEEPAAQHPQQ